MAQTSTDGLKKSIWAAAAPQTHTSFYNRRYRSHSPHRDLQFPPSSSSTPTATSTPPTTTTNSSSTFSNPTIVPPIHFDPGPSAAPPAPPRHLAPIQALHRLEQTCLRLRWKSLDLESAYRRTENAEAHGFDRHVAERNFKIDFNEFYAWIEQALVLLQRIFGVEILPGSGSGSKGHAFHHNVLMALGDEDNPLRNVMGRGEVNHALWKAKELRNRWKDAADGSSETPPLGMYDLQWIFGKILAGLEEAYGMAKVEVERVSAGNGVVMEGEGGGRQDEGWEWMVGDDMDWEA